MQQNCYANYVNQSTLPKSTNFCLFHIHPNNVNHGRHVVFGSYNNHVCIFSVYPDSFADLFYVFVANSVQMATPEGLFESLRDGLFYL